MKPEKRIHVVPVAGQQKDHFSRTSPSPTRIKHVDP